MKAAKALWSFLGLPRIRRERVTPHSIIYALPEWSLGKEVEIIVREVRNG